MKATPILALTLGVLAPVASAQRPAPSPEKLQEQLDKKLAGEWLSNASWLTSFDDAKAQAKETGKPIFAYFTRSYAP